MMGPMLQKKNCMVQQLQWTYGLFGNLTRPAVFAVEGGEYDHHRVSGVANSPGHPEDQDIYRGKLANLYTIATAVERFCRRYSITLGAITVACDGIEVLRKSIGNEMNFSRRSSQIADCLHLTRDCNSASQWIIC